jgi:N-acetylmuramoyl-L-alanine amidase
MFQRIILIIVVCLIPAIPGFSQKGTKIRTVVIDAGHGGKDPGAVGKHSKEKNITLEVALRTGKYIKQNLPDVKVIYTRSTDEFIELHRRAAIANDANADVFISIHCNSAKSTSVYGAETFIMGDHKNEANLEVAKLENAAILLEENENDEYGGFDPNSTPAYIALSLFQSEYKQQSLELAQTVQRQFTERAGRKDRSVQQAGFLVLYRTAMPAILIELGFLSNASEEAFLLSDNGKTFMAQCVYRAFREFKTNFERDNSSPPVLVATDDPEPSKEKPKEKPASDPKQEKKNEVVKEQPKDEKKSVPDKEKPAAEEKKPIVKEDRSNKASEKSTTKTGVIYKVQFYTSPKKIDLKDKRFQAVSDVDVYFHNGLYKYTSGAFSKLETAVNSQNQLRKAGFTDAFVAAFLNGERISMDEAKRLQP